MFTHDIIKIKYIDEGYLPNYPYHMISDKEMIDAFLSEEGYFNSNYPCIDESLEERYNLLREAISFHLNQYNQDSTPVPSWVYTYMLGNTLGPFSDEAEISYLCELLHLPDSSEFTLEIAENCYSVSEEWIKKLPNKGAMRPPTIFGEPHVLKSLRLEDVNVLE